MGPDSQDPGVRGPEDLGSPWRLERKGLEWTLWFGRCSGAPCPAVNVAEHAPGSRHPSSFPASIPTFSFPLLGSWPLLTPSRAFRHRHQLLLYG